MEKNDQKFKTFENRETLQSALKVEEIISTPSIHRGPTNLKQQRHSRVQHIPGKVVCHRLIV